MIITRNDYYHGDGEGKGEGEVEGEGEKKTGGRRLID